MATYGGDQEHQHRGVRERLKRDAVEKQSDRGHDQQRQRDVDGDRVLLAGEPIGQGENRHRQDDVDGERASDKSEMQRPAAGKQVEAKRHHAHRHRQSRGAGHLAGRQRGVGQRAIGDELALWYQDHARDGEHQHQRKAEQRIDRAVGDAVLHQEQHDRRVQGRALPLTRRPIALQTGSPDRPITAVEKCCRYWVWWITIIQYNLKGRPNSAGVLWELGGMILKSGNRFSEKIMPKR